MNKRLIISIILILLTLAGCQQNGSAAKNSSKEVNGHKSSTGKEISNSYVLVDIEAKDAQESTKSLINKLETLLNNKTYVCCAKNAQFDANSFQELTSTDEVTVSQGDFDEWVADKIISLQHFTLLRDGKPAAAKIDNLSKIVVKIMPLSEGKIEISMRQYTPASTDLKEVLNGKWYPSYNPDSTKLPLQDNANITADELAQQMRTSIMLWLNK